MRIYNASNPASLQLMANLTISTDSTLVHNSVLSADGNYMFTTEEVVNKSVKVWDIRNLSNIRLVAQYLAGGRPDTNIAHNVYRRGDTLYVSHYAQGLRVLDISDPLNMREIAYHKPPYPSHPAGFYTYGAFGAYIHLPSGNILSSHADLGLFVQRLAASSALSRQIPRLQRRPLLISGLGEFRFFLNSDDPYSTEIFNSKGQVLGHVK